MRTAIITGASSGLGRSFARQLVEAPAYFGSESAIEEFWLLGRNVAALDSLVEELQSKSNLRFRTFVCDLQNVQELEDFCQTIAREKPDITVLVNNAGGGKFGSFMHVPVEEQMTMLDVNVRALVRLTHAALPRMLVGSHLIQIASSAGFGPLPGMAVYSSSKAFVINFSRALRNEVKSRGIVVTTVCPGAIETDFFTKANEYATVESLSKKFMISSAEQVATKALKDAKRKKILSVYSLPIKLSHFMCKVLPHRLVSWFWGKAS